MISGAETALSAEERQDQRWQITLLILLLGYLLAFAIINFQGLTRFIDPDSYSDTVAARYMWEQKTLFPKGWVFGNQYYVVATPVLAALFYGLTGSMNLAMALATTAMTLFQLAALAWLLRSFLGRTQVLAGLTALVASVLAMNLRFKLDAQLLFLLGGYYGCYLLTLLVVWGDYTQGLFKGKQILCPAFFLGLFLSFATGMQSIRQTCIMVMPLLAFEGLRVLYMLVRRTARDWMPTLRTVCVTAANLAGVVLIRCLHVPALSVYGETKLIRPEQLPQQLKNLQEAALKVTGLLWYRECTPAWFVVGFSVLCCGTVILALARAAGRLKRGEAGPLDALIALCVISLAAVAVSGLLFNILLRSPYFFVWYLLVCLSAVSLVGKGRGKQAALFLLCGAAAVNLWYSYKPNVAQSIRADNSVWAEVADELTEQNYEILYGRYWDTGIICAHTDGKVLYSPWFFEAFNPLTYICPQDLRGPEDHLRGVYLILDDERENARLRAEEVGAELTLVREFGGMALYTSSKQLMYPG